MLFSGLGRCDFVVPFGLVGRRHAIDWEELSEIALDFPAGPNHDRERVMIIYGLSRDKSGNAPGNISNCFRLCIACKNVFSVRI